MCFFLLFFFFGGGGISTAEIFIKINALVEYLDSSVTATPAKKDDEGWMFSSVAFHC